MQIPRAARPLNRLHRFPRARIYCRKMEIEGSEYETLLATAPDVGRHVPLSIVEDEDRTGFALFAQRGQ